MLEIHLVKNVFALHGLNDPDRVEMKRQHT